MLAELLSAVLFGPVTACDTARAAMGTCSSQLSVGVVSGSGFALNISRETTSTSSSTVVTPHTASSTPSTSASKALATTAPKAPATAPKPATTSKPKPATTAPKPAATSKPKPTVVQPAVAKPAPQCPITDPPLARIYQPPCGSSSKPKLQPLPSPSPKPAVSSVSAPARPAAPTPTANLIAPPRNNSSSQTTSSSETTTQQQTLAGFAPEVRLSTTREARVHDLVEFNLAVASAETQGQLFGSSATIRFTPVSATIAFGDGQRKSGPVATGSSRFDHSYGAAGAYLAEAIVRFRVDYRIGQDPWVVAAAWVEVASNPLQINVLQPLRRTLLVPAQFSD